VPAVAWCYMLLINVLQSRLLRKAAKAAAKLFKFELPRDFSSTWVVRRGFGRGFHFPNTNLRASRQVCELMLRSKVQDALRHRESMQPFINHPHLDLLDSLIKALEELVPHLLPHPSGLLSLLRCDWHNPSGKFFYHQIRERCLRHPGMVRKNRMRIWRCKP